MTRRLEPRGTYQGRIWGNLPSAYPTEQAERVYRALHEELQSGPSGTWTLAQRLVGQAFKGVAYRFRAAAEYCVEHQRSLEAPGGSAPVAGEEFVQERALFGFFCSALASLESFAFAVHCLAAHYEPAAFLLDEKHLRQATPEPVSRRLAAQWPNAPIGSALSSLKDDPEFVRLSKIRNVLSHRAVPSRLIMAGGGSIEASWQLGAHGAGDEALGPQGARLTWLTARTTELWNAVEQSFPP
jgi:hypothetical protein